MRGWLISALGIDTHLLKSISLSFRKMRENLMLFLNSDPSTDLSFSFIAGPCSVESYEIFRKVALSVKKAGACALRGGIYKMRTHAHAFQG